MFGGSQTSQTSQTSQNRQDVGLSAELYQVSEEERQKAPGRASRAWRRVKFPRGKKKGEPGRCDTHHGLETAFPVSPKIQTSNPTGPLYVHHGQFTIDVPSEPTLVDFPPSIPGKWSHVVPYYPMEYHHLLKVKFPDLFLIFWCLGGHSRSVQREGH